MRSSSAIVDRLASSSATDRVRVAVAAFALVSLALLVRAGRFHPSLVFFGLWLLLPFILAWRAIPETDASRARLVAAIVATLPPLLAYIALAIPIGRQSSTSGLAWAFFPLWHLMLVGVCFGVASALERWNARPRKA